MMNKDGKSIPKDGWIIYFEKIKAIRPDALKDFIETLTEFVRQYPDDASMLTINKSLQFLLTES